VTTPQSRWTAQVAELTRPYRERRARELTATGMDLQGAAHKLFLAGKAAARDPVLRVGKWHLQRARGQRERFERASNCEADYAVTVHCSHCGRTDNRAARCRAALVCVSCRGKIASEKRARLSVNRRRAIDLCAKAGLLRHNRRGGAWSEKLITLTAPHFKELGVRARIDFVRSAWRYFRKSWGAWLEEHPSAGAHADERGHSLARWFRNIEWTTGADEAPGEELGHPHIHMWFLGPYLAGAKASEAGERQNLIQNFWAAALAKAALEKREGVPVRPELTRLVAVRDKSTRRVTRLRREILPHVAAACAAPIVDVRRCRPGRESLQEVIKYLFKDFAMGGGQLSPHLWAQVFESFDGTRTTQGSVGLATLGVGCFRIDLQTGEVTISLAVPCRCKARGYWRVFRRPMTDAERAAARARRMAKGLAKGVPHHASENLFRRLA
jgi:hypothetical protein